MTFRICIIVWLTLCCAFPVSCQEDPKEKNFGELGVPEARESLAKPLSATEEHEYVEQTIRAERLDLLTLCFETHRTSGWVFRLVKAMPNSPFKEKAILMMLRSPSIAWQDGDDGFRSYDFVRRATAESFIPMVRTYLPETPLTYEVIGSPEKRQKLAKEIEAVIAHQNGSAPKSDGMKTPAAPSLVGSKSGELLPDDSSIPTTEQQARSTSSTRESNVVTQPVTGPASQGSSRQVWGWIALTSIVVGAIWLLARRVRDGA